MCDSWKVPGALLTHLSLPPPHFPLEARGPWPPAPVGNTFSRLPLTLRTLGRAWLQTDLGWWACMFFPAVSLATCSKGTQDLFWSAMVRHTDMKGTAMKEKNVLCSQTPEEGARPLGPHG